MKKSYLLIFAFAFFLTVNTSYYWEQLPGLWDAAIFLTLIVSFLILLGFLIYKIVQLFKRNQRTLVNVLNVVLLSIILSITYVFPSGVIDYEQFESPAVYTAYYEGAGNCSSTFVFKKDFTFKQKSMCFGMDVNVGNYATRGDTLVIVFKSDNENNVKRAYGIVSWKTVTSGEMLFFKNSILSKPLTCSIIKQ